MSSKADFHAGQRVIRHVQDYETEYTRGNYDVKVSVLAVRDNGCVIEYDSGNVEKVCFELLRPCEGVNMSTHDDLVDEAIKLSKQLWPNEDGVVIESCLGSSLMDSDHIYNREWFIVKTWSGMFAVPQPKTSASRSLQQLVQDLRDLVEERGVA